MNDGQFLNSTKCMPCPDDFMYIVILPTLIQDTQS